MSDPRSYQTNIFPRVIFTQRLFFWRKLAWMFRACDEARNFNVYQVYFLFTRRQRARNTRNTEFSEFIPLYFSTSKMTILKFQVMCHQKHGCNCTGVNTLIPCVRESMLLPFCPFLAAWPRIVFVLRDLVRMTHICCAEIYYVDISAKYGKHTVIPQLCLRRAGRAANVAYRSVLRDLFERWG